jgi:hypothetical protein
MLLATATAGCRCQVPHCATLPMVSLVSLCATLPLLMPLPGVTVDVDAACHWCHTATLPLVSLCATLPHCVTGATGVTSVTLPLVSLVPLSGATATVDVIVDATATATVAARCHW